MWETTEYVQGVYEHSNTIKCTKIKKINFCVSEVCNTSDTYKIHATPYIYVPGVYSKKAVRRRFCHIRGTMLQLFSVYLLVVSHTTCIVYRICRNNRNHLTNISFSKKKCSHSRPNSWIRKYSDQIHCVISEKTNKEMWRRNPNECSLSIIK